MSVALLIGCNYTGTNYRLFGCINDCLLIQKMLITNYNFKNDNIIFMRDDIYDSNNSLYPNYDNIKLNLNLVLEKCILNKVELLYIHFSGHGSFLRDISRDEIDGNDEFIVPCDFFTKNKRITDDELFDYLKTIPSYTKCFTVFDCCNSGTILDLPFSYYYQNKQFIEKVENQNSSLNNKSNIICLSACRDNEYALDISKDGIANGAMSIALYSVLNNKKWLCDLNTLINDIYQYLSINNFKGMRPVLSCNKKIDPTNINFNFKEPNRQDTVLYIDNTPITINVQQQTTPTTQQQPAPTTQQQPAPTQQQPAPTTQQQPAANSNMLSVQSILEMCLRNNLCSKQELKDLIAKITA